MKKIIGIYGLSGAGKTTFCTFLKELGCTVVDVDEIGRKILEKGSEGLSKVVKLFGEDILFPDGSLNRKKLGGIVFADAEKLGLLNSVTKPAIEKELLKIIKKAKGITVIDGALVNSLEAVKENCDEIILLTADRDLLISRIIKREGLDEKSAADRIERQIESFSENCTGRIENNGDLEELKKKAERMIKYVSQGRTIDL